MKEKLKDVRYGHGIKDGLRRHFIKSRSDNLIIPYQNTPNVDETSSLKLALSQSWIFRSAASCDSSCGCTNRRRH